MDNRTSLHHRRRIRTRRLVAVAAALAAFAAVIYYQTQLKPKARRHDGKPTGEEWMKELLNSPPERIKNNLGISQEGFFALKTILETQSQLESTRYMTTTEQLGIFLYAVVTNLSMRELAERFQRSTETINRTYHKVMQHFLYSKLYRAVVKSASSNDELSSCMADKNGFLPYFADAIGAVDCTRIPVSPPHNEVAAFRDRSGHVTMNILAAINFNMRFTHVLSGWEGSTTDSELWGEAHRCGALCIPDGKYALGDAGLPSCDKCLTPYQGIRYHLQKWSRSNQRPQNREELFNFRHAQARNIIKRGFGVMKERFHILTRPRPFKMPSQVRILTALCVLHNILVDLQEYDDNVQLEVDDDEDNVEKGSVGYQISEDEKRRADKRRDDIAQAMWDDYNKQDVLPICQKSS